MGTGPGFTPEGAFDVASTERPGATVVDGGVRFEVWAPDAATVEVDVDGARQRLTRLDGGVFAATLADVGPGARYRFSLDGRAPLPDPASRWQPDGVFGASAVVDPGAWSWSSPEWSGVELADTVLYELHVGTFTDAGTFDAAISELPRLAATGITTIELMPLAQFSGEHGWGYDGVFPNAVHHSYGGPAAMARFVDAAHATGLAVIVDVVYNHFGPEGNVAPEYGPYLTDAYSTPWGGAINLAGPGSDQVRRLFLDNVRMWIGDFRCDGLRVDAVHAIVDPTSLPFLEELVATARAVGDDRTVLTILESASNDPRMLTPPPSGFGADAQWNDEYHHALRVALTGDRSGYYEDFDGVGDVAEVLAHGFKYRGAFSPVRGRRHGRDVAHIAPDRFVVFDQNHDQIGNRRDGDRLGQLVDFEQRKLALAAVLLSPFTPMLFQGEEYGDPAPFPFFVDHSDPDLLEAVRAGRAAEFAAFEWDAEPPDPGGPETFRSAVLRSELAEQSPHRELLALTTELLRLRREVRPLTDPDADVEVVHLAQTVVMRRRAEGRTAVLSLHFGGDPDSRSGPGDEVTVVLDTSSERWAGPGRGAWAATLALDR